MDGMVVNAPSMFAAMDMVNSWHCYFLQWSEILSRDFETHSKNPHSFFLQNVCKVLKIGG